MHSKTKQISFIKIDAEDNVSIVISENIIVASEEDGGPSKEFNNTYPVECEFKPHKDFMDALLSCRKFGLDLGEFSNEDRTQYTVESLKIAGNMAMQNARVSFVLNKYVKRTGKNIKIAPGEATMYGDDYKDATKMTKAVEKVMEEAWLYIGGKNGENIQLSLFFQEEETA